MNDPVYHQLLETAWKRPLSSEESARLEVYLEAHPEDRSAWEEEMSLKRLLERLPERPVSSRFTARVMAAVEGQTGPEPAAETVAESPLASWLAWLRSFGWAPRIAAVTLAAVLAGVGYQQYQAHLRAERARSVALVADVAALPELGLTMTTNSLYPAPDRFDQATVSGVQVFQDFEPIYRLSQVPPPMVDDELLAALE
jgi:negative regulator of sigma E activity